MATALASLVALGVATIAPTSAAPGDPGEPALRVLASGAGDGTVIVTVGTAPSVLCAESECLVPITPMTTVVLVAAPWTDNHFAGWSGACAYAAANPRCELTIPLDAPPTIDVAADFAPRGPVLNLDPPTIFGIPLVGMTLTSSTGVWAPDIGVTLTYQWLRDGAPIDGETAAQYTLTEADTGAEISLQVVASRDGNGDGFAVAQLTEPVTAQVISIRRPVVSGVARVRGLVVANPGAWGPSGTNLSYRYQWVRRGRPIEGATNRAYRPRRADVGRVLAVRVDAEAPDFQSASRTSRTVRVRPPRPGTGDRR